MAQLHVIGDEYQGATIYWIERGRVLLDRNGNNESIDDSGPGPSGPGVREWRQGVRQISDRQYVMPRTEMDGWLNDLPRIATQARIVPSFRNGLPDGFKIFSIVPD